MAGLGWRSGRTPPAAAATPASDSTAAPASRPSFQWADARGHGSGLLAVVGDDRGCHGADHGLFAIQLLRPRRRPEDRQDLLDRSRLVAPTRSSHRLHRCARPSALHQHRRHPTDQVTKSVEASVHEHSHGALAAAHHLGHLADVHSRHDPQEHRVGLIGGQPAHQRRARRPGRRWLRARRLGRQPRAGRRSAPRDAAPAGGSSSCRRRRAMVNSQRRKSSGPPPAQAAGCGRHRARCERPGLRTRLGAGRAGTGAAEVGRLGRGARGLPCRQGGPARSPRHRGRRESPSAPQRTDRPFASIGRRRSPLSIGWVRTGRVVYTPAPRHAPQRLCPLGADAPPRSLANQHVRAYQSARTLRRRGWGLGLRR